jgi:hypothetical protein
VGVTSGGEGRVVDSSRNEKGLEVIGQRPIFCIPQVQSVLEKLEKNISKILKVFGMILYQI